MQNETSPLPRPSAHLDLADQSWGFLGTIADNFGVSREVAADVYDLNAHHLIARLEVRDLDEARRFLDSRQGRHLADAATFHRPDEPTAGKIACAVLIAGPKEFIEWFRHSR